MESLGLRWGLMMTPCDMFKVPDDEFETGLEQWARWLERARAAGCTRAYNHFWPGSDERPFDENFEWHHKRLTKIWHVMEETGMQYGLEFMGAQTVCDQFKHPFIRSLCGTIALADSVSEKIGIVFDGIHWYTSALATMTSIGHSDTSIASSTCISMTHRHSRPLLSNGIASERSPTRRVPSTRRASSRCSMGTATRVPSC